MEIFKSISSKSPHPFTQAGIVLGLYLMILGALKFIEAGGLSMEPRLPWTLSLAFLLLYIIYNVILGLNNNSIAHYWLYSIGAYMIFSAVVSITAKWISGLKMDEAGSYRWLFFVFFISYFVFMVMVILIKQIVAIAQKEDDRFEQKNK